MLNPYAVRLDIGKHLDDEVVETRHPVLGAKDLD